MSISRRIFISMPSDRWLNDNQNSLKWAIVDKIRDLGYIPEIFSNPRYMPGKISNQNWDPDKASEIMRACIGGVLIGLPRWQFNTDNGVAKLATEFSHYEGALMKQLKLPMLIVAQQDISQRTVFNYNFGPNMGFFNENDDEQWLTTNDFMVPFQYWKDDLDKRKDIFIGYCSSASKTAQQIIDYLKTCGVKVLDWREFKAGEFILNEIAKASDMCTGGIFLFSKDDFQISETVKSIGMPRDNVVLEAGYFISAKDKSRVLIIRENDSKMPADLGGDIYGALDETNDINAIQSAIDSFLKAF